MSRIEKAEIQNYFSGHYQDFFAKYLPAGVKKIGGDEYQAKCPFHDDKNPSLTINRNTGAFYCFGCQAKGGFLDFYAKINGLDTRRDFPKVLDGIARDFGIEGEGVKSRLVSTYDYTDETGTLLFQACRFEPGEHGKSKHFRQRRPDGKGGWIEDIKEVRRVLYRLPEVCIAGEVLIVEGEKDADTLHRLGFTATSCPMGAGKWRAEYNESLKEKGVYLIGDNDAPGRAHVEQIARSLNGHKPFVRVIELPGMGEGQDVTDFVRRFKTKDEAVEALSGLMAGAKEYQEEAPEVKAGPTLIDGIIGAEDFARIDLPAPTTYLDPIITGRKIILISGYRGVGKTWAGLSIADSITRGIAWGPWEAVTPAVCFYLDGEMACQDIQARIRGLNPAGERRAPLLLYSDAYASTLGLPRASILNPQWRAEIQKILLDLGVKVFVIDNLSSLTGGLDENSKQEWDPVNQWLISLRFAGITSIMLHHVGKGGQQRGTSGREDNIDLSIVLKQPADYEADQGADFTLSVTKSRVGIDDLGKLRDVHFTLRADTGGVLTWTWQWAKSEKRSEILALLDAGESVTDIAALVGVSKPYVSKVNRERKR